MGEVISDLFINYTLTDEFIVLILTSMNHSLVSATWAKRIVGDPRNTFIITPLKLKTLYLLQKEARLLNLVIYFKELLKFIRTD